jgi:sterol desaturase/sphingolipid hydroxylase (fatty acid hydroxylase superfamily)
MNMPGKSFGRIGALAAWSALVLLVSAIWIATPRDGDAGPPFSLGWARADWLIHKIVHRIADNVHDALAAPFNPSDRFFLGYLALSFLVFGALVFVLAERRGTGGSLLGFLFPKQLYRHRSARIDYAVFALNRLFSPAVLITRLWSAASIGTLVTAVLIATFGARQRVLPNGVWDAVLFTFITALVTDFGDYLSHALHHRIPLLWEFHKLHHSAEVLTPITVARVHPIEQVVGASVSTVMTGTAMGIAGYFFLEQPEPILFFGAQVVSFAFMAAGSHLRHSHIWLSWGPLLSHVVISPAQHQVHHSVKREHFDRNYGFIFALWDWLFGTLYVPRTKETLTFGLGEGEPMHTTVWRAYADPFKGAAGLVARRLTPAHGAMRNDPAAR